MNELEKCMAGESYNCHDKVFLDFKIQARKLLKEYHDLAYEQKEQKRAVLKQLLGGIGDNVLIASNVQLYTAAHPVELEERLTPGWTPETEQYFCRTYALPIKIESGCWLGGGVIVLPGVTIGSGSVIGAGSVVTKNIPENVLAVGNPCRVIRKINERNAR